jgi:transcriptional regulator with XRE-family HTH domain
MAYMKDREVIPGKARRRRRPVVVAPRFKVTLNKEVIFAKLRSIARVRGLSLRQFAAMARESRSWIDYALRSPYDLKVTTLIRLAHIAGLLPGALLDGAYTIEEGRTNKDDLGHQQALQEGNGRR